MLSYDSNNKMYVMEKIHGLSVTSLYLSELLTIDNLKYIMDSIKRIQSVKVPEQVTVNIYDNYSKKLEKRYADYDYQKFPNSQSAFQSINNKLKVYESSDQGHVSVIHGDTVMTNIMIDTIGKIKFIDMRGRINDVLTIYGDWLYDWAKLYQSLIGYDKILQDKCISQEYETMMINYFEARFIELYSINDFNNLKLITQSLLFTLIPLHDNAKCIQYYNLISCITL
jgi:hypothetical protein